MDKILIIEDELDVRENLHDLLEVEGYDVSSAPNGRAGIDQALQRLPDLIICDIQMPEMNGHQVLQNLRQNPATVSTPFIFLTARASHSDHRLGMSLGADDYLTKPFTADEVLDAVATRLRKRAVMVNEYDQKMDELRRNMAQMLPHELRTPLTLILGYSSLLLETQSTPDLGEVQEMAAGILQAGERMQGLIRKFLLYVELKLNTQSRAIHVPDFGEHPKASSELIERIGRQKAAEAGRAADLHVAAQGETTIYAEERITQLLSELLDNAFKFSAPGTPVQLATANDAGRLLISVTNQGRGMTPEQIAQVGAYMQFERNHHEQQGLGLGLAIAQLAAEHLGGGLSIQSIPDQSITVQVSLPTA